jgi:alkylated DNA repair dioxygenase AlkB
MSHSDLDIIYIPGFLKEYESNTLFSQIKENVFLNGQMNTDPKVLGMPRLIKWFGDIGYGYSSIYHPPQVIPKYIEEVMLKVNNFLLNQQVNSQMNSVLINYYRDGKDKINYHSDDLSQIGEEPVISSLSLGDSRIFKFKNKETKEKVEFTLNNGDLFIMKGKTQDIWQHGVLPEEQKGERINLTFRNTKFEPLNSKVKK